MTGCRIPHEGTGGRWDPLRPLMNWRVRTVGHSLGARRASHTVSPPQPLRHVLVFPGTFPNPGTCPAMHAQPAATAAVAVAAAAVGKMGVIGLQGPPQGGAKCQGAARGWEEGQWLAHQCPCCWPCPCLAFLVASMYTCLLCPGDKVHPCSPGLRGCSLVSQLAVGPPGCLH